MRLLIENTEYLNGSVLIPSSKSQSVRALFFALLAKGESTLTNLLESTDVEVAMGVCKKMGATINQTGNTYILKSNGLPFKSHTDTMYTGNSGITTRFLLPILGLRKDSNMPITVDCGKQMRTRPIKSLVEALKKLGMRIKHLQATEGFPLQIEGHLIGGKCEISGFTSQYLSALLIALPCALSDSEIVVTQLNERPYIEMTLAWLKEQGILFNAYRDKDKDIYQLPGNQRYSTFTKKINSDFSSASCLLAAAAIKSGTVEFLGLDIEDPQGDKRLLTILQEMGADILVQPNRILIQGGKVLRGIEIDANDVPDLLPALAILGSQAEDKTIIRNVQQARIKETDRIHSMVEGLKRMGAKVDEHADGLTIYKSKLQGGVIDGHEDHRTVMAFTVAGLCAEGSTIVNDGLAILKTYPTFVKTMQSLKAKISIDREIKNKHLILIGFKHVGKSEIGKQLANKLHLNFIDLDQLIEKRYTLDFHKAYTCREILQTHGLSFFRKLETKILKETLKLKKSVIALGGGTLLTNHNQKLVKDHLLINVTAPKGIVFERIMVNGRPSFFHPEKEAYETFSDLWDKRIAIYQRLGSITIENNSTIYEATQKIINQLVTAGY